MKRVFKSGAHKENGKYQTKQISMVTDVVDECGFNIFMAQL